MPAKISALEMFMDFLHMGTAILLSVFCFVYFVLGNRLGLAEDIARLAGLASIFGLFFLYESKQKKKEYKFKKNSMMLDDILVYFSEYDKRKDLFLAAVFPAIALMAIAIGEGQNDVIDKLQAISIFITAYAWHRYLFRRQPGAADLMYATYYDKIKDNVFVFILPAIVLAEAVLSGRINAIDQAQALSVFLLYYFWHKYLIRNKN